MTQRDVAKRLGIPQSIVSELENGQRRLDVAELQSLALLFGRPIGWFFVSPPHDGVISIEHTGPLPSDPLVSPKRDDQDN